MRCYREMKHTTDRVALLIRDADKVRTILFAGLLTATTMYASGTIYAAKTWNGAGADDNINTAGNWVGGNPLFSGSNSANNDQIFDGTTRLTPIIQDYNVSEDLVRNMTFAATAGAFVFGVDGSTRAEVDMNWSTGATTTVNNSSNAQTFNVDILTVRRGNINAAAADFVFNVPLQVGAGFTQGGINITGDHDLYANQGFTGNAPMTKNGNGTLYLGPSPVDSFRSTVNSPNGMWGQFLQINAGTVQINSSASLGEVGTDGIGYTGVTGADATCQLVLTGGLNSGEYIYANGRTTTAPIIVNKSGDNTLSGTINTYVGGNIVALQSDGTGGGDMFRISGTITTPSADQSLSMGGPTALYFQGAGNGIVSGNISEQNSNVWNVVKDGAGTWTFSGTNTYTGTTTVSAGTLIVNGTHTTGGLYTVASGATLGGGGTIDSSVALSGTIAPGNSPGTLTIGGLSVTSATLAFVLDPLLHTTGSGINSLIIDNGALDLSGGATLNVTSAGNISPGNYDLIQFVGALTGSSANIAVGSLPISVHAGATILTDANNVYLQIAALIPGDVNLDGVVNGLDISVLAGNWLSNGNGVSGDANGDGVVNGLDISVIASHWLYTTPTGGSGSAAAVPEPSTFALLVTSCLCGIFGVRRRWVKTNQYKCQHLSPR